MVFAFVVYIYTPARYNYGILHTMIQKVSALFLSFDVQSNPYASVSAPTGAAWTSPWIYPILTSFDIVIAMVALATAIWLAVHFWLSGLRFNERRILLLWLFAVAFGVEVLASIIADLSGFLGGNLQLRLFPLFMLFAIPLAVLGVASLVSRASSGWRAPLAALGFIMVAFFALTGILKATNDPLVSNKWLFYTRNERSAMAWTESSLSRQEIWVGFDERLFVMQSLEGTRVPLNDNNETAGTLGQSARYVLMSDVIRQRGPRLEFRAPDVVPDDRIYDNGGAQLFHRTPETPYEP